MALIKCSKCGKLYSEYAKVCPACGYTLPNDDTSDLNDSQLGKPSETDVNKDEIEEVPVEVNEPEVSQEQVKSEQDKIDVPVVEQAVLAEVKDKSHGTITKLYVIIVILVCVICYQLFRPSKNISPELAEIECDTVAAEISYEEYMASQRQVIIDFLKDMLINSKMYDYAFLKEHCTNDMLIKLANDCDNEHSDGELMYAVNEFGTLAQYPKPNSKDLNRSVVSVEESAVDWYIYKIRDNGWNVTKSVQIEIQDNVVLINDIKNEYDEALDSVSTELEKKVLKGSTYIYENLCEVQISITKRADNWYECIFENLENNHSARLQSSVGIANMIFRGKYDSRELIVDIEFDDSSNCWNGLVFIDGSSSIISLSEI